MATTYVQISRRDLEQWLNTMPRFRGNWWLDKQTAGIYYLPLSDNVAIKLSSTVGSEHDAMKKGRASMQLRLVSLVTGRVLNKKAQGQKGYHRTTNWQTNWKKGIDGFVAVYTKSADFYERIALPEDQQQQQGGGVPQQPVDWIPASDLPGYLEDLRNLWAAVNEAGDQRSADFVKSVGAQVKKSGRRPSEKQRNWLGNLSDRHGRRAEEIGRMRSQRRVAGAWLRRVAKANPDKVQVVNEKGRKVWVTKDTLKGPKGKNYKPVKDDGGKGKGGGLKDKLTKFFGGAKKVPKAVGEFVTDPKSRKKVMSAAADKLKSAGSKLKHKVGHELHHLKEEYKDAGKAVAKLAKGKPISKKEAKGLWVATVSVGVGAASGFLAGGALAGFGTFGVNTVKHMVLSAISPVFGTAFAAGETGALSFKGMEIATMIASEQDPNMRRRWAALAKAAEKGDESDFYDKFSDLITTAIQKRFAEGLSDKDIADILEGKEPPAPKLG
jgi:hypothetical protein